jgi:hypothetical protein
MRLVLAEYNSRFVQADGKSTKESTITIRDLYKSTTNHELY